METVTHHVLRARAHLIEVISQVLNVSRAIIWHFLFMIDCMLFVEDLSSIVCFT